ncbi:hypothetical protein ACJMK2_006851 [Sinanodonta woodiana]|uniref:Uncharacterized protein n=1 Tax=Sinanodonta woodiana TaxID=1069815 RepID=A0ABD3VUF8_SINWO
MAESGERKASSVPNEEDGFAVVEENFESDNASSPGKVCYLKLLIKHAKGVEMEKKAFKCSFHFHAIWNFYNQTDCGRKMLEAILEKHHCCVSLAKDEPFQGLFVFQILNQCFHEKSDVEQFVKVVLNTVKKNAEDELLLSKFPVDPRLHRDVLERVRQTKELNSVWIESGGEQGHEIYMVYLQEHKMIAPQRMLDIVNAIEESFKNHEESVCVDLMWKRVMVHFGYLQKVNHKFPNLMISYDESKNVFVLKGPRDEAKAAADAVLELLETAQHEISEVCFAPECDLSIFSHPKMCAYVKSVIPKVHIFWILNLFKKTIHVFAKDPKQLQGIDEAIKGCVQKKLYPVLKDHSTFYKERARYLEELKEQHTGKLVMHSSAEGLHVTAADDIIEIVDAAIQKIISRERGADQDAHKPENQDKRDRPPFSKSIPARTGGFQDTSDLISMKGIVTERGIKKTISVANTEIFHKLVEKDLEEFKCKGEKLHVIVRAVETETKIGFEVEGSTEKVRDVLQFIKQRIEVEERQLHAQKSIVDSTGATASPEEGNIADPNATGQTESNETADNSCVLKLLIKYLKSVGEDDTIQHQVQCSFDFQAIWNFFNQTDCGRKMLEAILENHHCCVSLAKDEPFQGLFVFQILNQCFHEKSDVEQFVKVVLNTVKKNAEDELLLSKFPVDPRLHRDVLERVRQTKELNSVWIESGGEQGHEIYMVYLQEHKMIAPQRMLDIVNAIEESFKNHEESVCVDLMWKRVMVHFGYLQKVNHKFPNLMISSDESKEFFVLKGARDEAKAAADAVLELLETAQHEISEVTFSPSCQLEIFTHSEMCAYINRAIPKVAVVWLLNPLTKKIHIFAEDPKQLQGIDKAIKGCVQEKLYPVLKDHSTFYKERARYLEELKEQHTGKLVMHSSAEGLHVTAADDIIEIVDAAIQKIISRERGADQDAHKPENQDKRDRPPFSKSIPARTGGFQDTSDLISMKGIVTERGIKKTISVANTEIFHKLVEKDLEEFKCKGEKLHVIVREVETETKIGFEVEGSTEKVRDVLQFIKQRIKVEERQLHAQKSIVDSTGATASPEEGNIADPNATGQTESNETADNSCVLKLLIKYLKSVGEDDTIQHQVQCSFDFQAIWNFFNQTDCGRKMLEAILENHHCCVSLAKDEPFQGLFVFQILNQCFHEKSDVEQFVKVVLNTVKKNAEDELLLSKFPVDPRLHRDVLERVRQTKELNSVWIESGGEQGHEIYMVYLQEHKMIAPQRMLDIVNAIEESFKNHEESVCVNLMWKRVMVHFGYLQKVNHKFPNLMISSDESKEFFVLKGARDEAKAAADAVLELLETAQHEISEVTFSPSCQLEIFTHSEMCAYINRAIPKVAVVWLLNPLTKKIHIFAKDSEQLQGIDKAIKGCVQEKLYPVLKDHSTFYKERARYLEELKEQHTGKLVMHSSAEGLHVTAADDIIEIVDAAIQKIISRERGADQDAHKPENQDKRDRPPFSKSIPARTGGFQDTSDLISMKGIVTERGIKKTISVANTEIFHKLVEKDLEEFKCKGEKLHVIVREVETETKIGFEVEGSTEKVRDVLQFIKQRIEVEERQLHAQKSIVDSTGATASPEEGNIADPNATGQTESNETSDKSCVLKVLIKYLKSLGEDDTIQHQVQCSFDFHAIWNFYNQTDCGRKMLEAILENHHCRVSLAKDEPFQGFFVFQILNQQFHEKSDVEQFVKVVLDTVQKNAEDELLLSKFPVDPRLHRDVLERVRQTKELNSVWIESGGEQGHEIYMVYLQEHKMIAPQRMLDIVNAIEESFKNHEESVCVDLMWKRVMVHFGYLEKVNHKFPNLMISNDESKEFFVLKGARDEAKAAADAVLELLETAQHEISEVTFSPSCQLEIFTHSEMCAYINRAIPKVAVVWLLNPLTKKIHIFAKDSEQLQGIDKAIKGCVQEKLYPVLKDHSTFYKERARYLEELKEQHTGKLVMHSSAEGLHVTAADDIIEIVDAAIQKIISRERGADQDAHKPENQDKRDRPPFSKSIPARTGGFQDTSDLISMKGIVTERGIKKTISVANTEIFHKLVEKDLEEFKCKGEKLHVIVREVETETKIGFEVEGSTEKVRDVLQFIKQRIKVEERQLHAQKSIVDSTGATASPEEGNIADPNATGQTESNETAAKPDDPGHEQREWSYPNGKKIMLVKAKTCDADVIIIPGNSDKDGQSQFGGKKLVKLKVPKWTEGKAKTDLQEEVEQVLKQILEKIVGICIRAVERWKFNTYLKCLLFQIKEYFMRKGSEPCPIECVILLVDDALDYKKAMEIIQESFKLKQDKSEVFASQEILPQEQGPIIKRIRVKVKKGQLHEAQVEVLVNTLDRSLDLTKGVISSSLLDKAGNGIQKELQQYQGKAGFGEVLKTGGGTLPKPCKVIFHGVLYVYEENSDCVKVFQDFIAGCLEDANKKYRSIAFPPIGTGKLRYPKDFVASAMFQSVAKFEEAHPTSKLEEVIFVIYEKDQETLKIFEQMHRKFADASFGKGTEQQGASLSSSETPIPTILKGHFKAVDGTAPSKLKTVVKEPDSPVITQADRSEVKEPVYPVIKSEEKDIAPPKVISSGNMQLKDILEYSEEEKCCFFVYGIDKEGAKKLRRQITSPNVEAKFVYPYETQTALVICQNLKEKDTIMNNVKNKYEVQCVGPQKFQRFTAVVDPVICRKATKMIKVKDLVEIVQKRSGVTIDFNESSIEFKAVTSRQLEIAQECLIAFAKETLEINVQGRFVENSGDFENTEEIENVSQTEFLALKSLEVYSKLTQKFNIKFTHDKETLYVQGDILHLNEEMKKEIEKEITILRGKQKTELTYDPKEITQFRSAVDEAKSDELLLVWDDVNKQVLVYSDSYDDMQKFKHRVEFKMGKKKPTGRSGRRFAEQVDTKPLLSEEESPTKKTIGRSFSWSQDASNVEIFKTLEGIMVKVYKANILRLDVDCIVNAANDNLQHGGGVALVIAKAAGPEIDREGSDILKIRGRIKVGEQCVTTAGNLPYDCIIHTVGPRWSDYYPHDARNRARCEADLFNSIIGCFIEAENCHLKSIALPAISSGIFAVPRDMCTEQYAQAVIHYSKTRTSLVLQEIHFIDMVPDIVNDMQLAFKRHLSCDGNAKHKVNSGDQTPAINNQAGRVHGNNQHDTTPEKNVGAASLKDVRQTEEKQNLLAPVWPKFEEQIVKEKNFHVYRPNENMAVYIYTADITKLTGIAAVVCSDDIRGNGYGAVASALLEIGKSTYKSVKKKAFEKEARFGDVIVTLGGDSNFDLVIHAVVPSFKDKISSQRHRELVQICYDKILNDANNWGKASLAIPFIGTGCAEIGYEGSAKLFLDSLEVFCNRAETLNLKVIYIVDRDKHKTEKIVDVFRKHTDRVRRNLVVTHDKSAWHPSSHTSSVGPQGEMSQVKPKTPVSGALSKEDCHICLNKVKSPKTSRCGHTFCNKCVESKPACPTCGAFHRIIYGDQPEGGEMKVTVLKYSLKGFENRDILKIEYRIPRGKQGPNHPEPGKVFTSLYETAYLPDTTEGRKVCDLLRVAFERRLIFTFRRPSWSVGHVLTWNDIHHKTTVSVHVHPYMSFFFVIYAHGLTKAHLS